jgi:hypothetical protein
MHRKQLDAGPSCARVSLLALGLAVLVAACTGGGAVGEKAGDGGKGRPIPGKAPTCAGVADQALGTAKAESPAIAFGGGKLATVWTEASKLRFAVFDTSGKKGGEGILSTSANAKDPAVTALAEGGFLVVWAEPGAVRGIRVGADARPNGAAFTIASPAGGESHPVAAGNVVAWTDTPGVLVGDLAGTDLRDKTTLPGVAKPALDEMGDGLVFTSPDGKLGFARLSKPLKTTTPVSLGDDAVKANWPRASPTGDGRFYVTWEDGRAGDGNETVYLALVGADGKQAAEGTVPSDTGSANYPDVTTVDGYAGVVYYQFRDGHSYVYLSVRGPELKSAGDDLRISAKDARWPRVASSDDGTIGIVYTLENGPAHLALVPCH